MPKRVDITGVPDFRTSTFPIKASRKEAAEPGVVLSPEELAQAENFTPLLLGLKADMADFRSYAENFFSRLYPEISDPEMKNRLVQQALREVSKLDFKSFLHEGMLEDMRKVIQTYGPKVAAVYLWSQGDIAITGMQVYKIFRSGIGRVLKSPEAESLRGKLHWAVEKDKFEGLARRLGSEDGEGKTKVVIIEDKLKNFETVREQLKDSAEIFPIWASYSSAGRRLKAHSPSEFEAAQRLYNGVNSFGEIADRKNQFGPNFENAKVLVDFDGVIMDTEKIRKGYAPALLKAIIASLGLKGEERKALFGKFLQMRPE